MNTLKIRDALDIILLEELTLEVLMIGLSIN